MHEVAYCTAVDTHPPTPYLPPLYLFSRYANTPIIRPLLDTSGRAVLLCHNPKREYLRKLLYEPLPIESHLDHVMAEHMNAEVRRDKLVR